VEESVLNNNSAEAQFYQIRFKGQLGPDWSDWFDGLTIVPQPNGEMLLIGKIVDQAALYGVLVKAQRLALHLISLEVVSNHLEEFEEGNNANLTFNRRQPNPSRPIQKSF
jgi:hypothetical protein